MFRTIQRRISISYVILILATMTALGLYLSQMVRGVYLDELHSKLSAEAHLIGEGLEPYLADGSTSETVNNLARHYADLLQIRVTIIDPSGKVIGESHDDLTRMENHLSRPEIAEALASGEGDNTRYSTTMGYQSLYVASAVQLDGKNAAVVRVSMPLSQVESTQAQLGGAILGATLLASVFAILLAMLIAAKITRPFRQLTQAAVDMAESDFQNTQISDRLIPATSDEVGHLTNAFNQMATKLRSQVDVLQAERSMIAAVFEAMSDGVLIVDSQGRLEMINPSAEEMFSVRREDVLGHSLAEGLRHHLLVELWQKSLESGKTESALLEIRAERLSLQAVAKPLSDDHSASTLLLITNLTRQRYLETVRRDFISNLSHELRTPLASLKALTETLQTGALDDPPAARRFLQRMETEVDALSQMVAELLELSRIESGRVPLQLKPVNPVDVITSAVDRLRMQAERAHLSLHIDPPSNLPNIQADLQRLEQVMVNLLHNAIKFTPPGGDIHVSARLEPGGEGTPESIVFIVRDTGVGIAAEDLPRIFERFYKADRARASGGTGLGLAIARHTVEAHSGRLWAESVEGKGSTFYFSIPVNPQ